MIYYNSNELSNKLEIKSAKWKRWAREFLPPDPLGGLQSGFARQFNLKDAFRVSLGGYLVSGLRFSIPEARQILADLSPWLRKHGFFKLQQDQQTDRVDPWNNYLIIIYLDKDNRLHYIIGSVRSSNANGTAKVLTEFHIQKRIGPASDTVAVDKLSGARMVAISRIYKEFLRKID